MVGMDHGAPEGVREVESVRSTRLGHVLFVLYLILYGTYVLVNAFAPDVMAMTPWAGINVAVLSGLGLIVAAFVFAVLYDWLCRSHGSETSASDEETR
jgi:uncharacterized membrane protein (DUF485 family)